MPANNLLNSIQLVAGCDMHKQIPPPPPAGPLPAPHVVTAVMMMAHPSGTKASTTVRAGWGFALGRQHDLSMGPYHFAANLLLPLVWLGAGNKAEFGSASVSIDVSGTATRLAVAVIPGVGLNLQLDCSEPCALPTSICVASLNTVYAGFSLADFIAGFVAMVVDIAITWVVGEIADVITGALGGLAIAGLAEVLALLGPEALLVGAIVEIVGGPVIHEAVKMGIGWLIGTPLGYSYTGPVPGTGGKAHFGPGSTYGGQLNDFINDNISPAPAPPPGASTRSPAPAGSAGQGEAPLDDPSQRNDEE
ncbi:MAG TPA: hypothetical protein VHM31_09000 [Polyangia bacterium]|nr:hypothetical protein [Polyangia bacterium]